MQPQTPQTFRSDPHEGRVLDTVGDFTVIACEHCGFSHVLPLPSAEDLRALYASTYYSETKPEYITRYEQDQAWWDIVFAERLAVAESWLTMTPPMPISSRRPLALDVGSGPGGFLSVAMTRGWNAIGLELSEVAAKYSREHGHTVLERGLLDDDPELPSGAFELVHLNEVLEHLPDPRAALARIWDILSPGGVVCIMVPNDYNVFQRAMRDSGQQQPYWVAPPHHLNYFDGRSLAGLLRRCGFALLDHWNTFPMEMFLLAGQNYVGDETLGRQCHAFRKALEINMELMGLGTVRRQIYRGAANYNIGRDIVMFGRKPQ